MIKLTIVIPIYKVEKYIEKCARSLFEQTLSDIEYIFVDDCSPDRSVEIIRGLIEIYRLRFAEERKVVRIESMPTNSGQAAVRRHGMLLASGEYVIHCDGDDWVDTDLYEKMYNKAKEDGADVVMCGYIREYENSHETNDIKLWTNNCKDIVREFYHKTIGMFCWNKLVKKSLYIDNDVLPWIGLNMWEDNGLMTRLLYYGGRLSAISGSYYHYNRSNVTAMTSCYGKNEVNQMIGIAKNLTTFFESKPDMYDFKQTIWVFQFLAKLNLITDSFVQMKEYNKLFPKANKMIKYIPYSAFSTKGKIRFWFVKHHLAWLFILMFKAKNLVA